MASEPAFWAIESRKIDGTVALVPHLESTPESRAQMRKEQMWFLRRLGQRLNLPPEIAITVASPAIMDEVRLELLQVFTDQRKERGPQLFDTKAKAEKFGRAIFGDASPDWKAVPWPRSREEYEAAVGKPEPVPGDDTPIAEDELLKRTGMSKKQLHKMVDAGLLPPPTVMCGMNPGMECLAPFYRKKPHCTDNKCLYPDRKETRQ